MTTSLLGSNNKRGRNDDHEEEQLRKQR